MAVEKMHLVNIMAKLENLDDFLEDLINIDEFDQVDAFRQIQNREFSIRASEENIDKTEDFNDLESFEKVDSSFIKDLEDIKDFLNIEDSSDGKRIDEEKLEKLIKVFEENIEKKKELEERNKKLEEYINNLQALENEEININKIRNLNYFNYRLGEVSKDGRFILKNNYDSIPSLIIHLQKNDPDININKEALKSIYSIDDETSKLRFDTDNIIKNENDNVNNVSIDLNKEYEKKTKEDSSKIYDDILKQADVKNKEIEKFYEKRKSESQKIFSSKKDSIVKEFFEKIIN
ncbi:ATP synthase subunit I [Anaerococcus jeddahensis]|uniref:ATP synthase subunit I n=1 Tax=Anaerococcus jeddahensis TaxID=1673719 RepID=UPI0006726890|nr:ATP synthase subunit I [Anaerococcus jeddahensis]